VPRFAILEHDYPERHWDFLLEAGPVLMTWKLEAPPQPGASISAQASFDHRLMYLDYEGPISGGRGSVSCWDRGSFAWELDTPGTLVVELLGAQCHGKFRLTRLGDKGWMLTWDV
jgi:hypothetical protein